MYIVEVLRNTIGIQYGKKYLREINLNYFSNNCYQLHINKKCYEFRFKKSVLSINKLYLAYSLKMTVPECFEIAIVYIKYNKRFKSPRILFLIKTKYKMPIAHYLLSDLRYNLNNLRECCLAKSLQMF